MAAILIVAILSNVIANVKFPALLDAIPVIGLSVWAVILVTAPLRQPDWKVMPETFKGTIFLLALVTCASMMPVEKLPFGLLADCFGPRLRIRGVRQYSADRTRPETGRL